MRESQRLIKEYKAEGKQGQGSFGIGLHGTCLHSEPPGGELYADIFVQISPDQDFLVFNQDFPLTQSREGWQGDLSTWPMCNKAT